MVWFNPSLLVMRSNLLFNLSFILVSISNNVSNIQSNRSIYIYIYTYVCIYARQPSNSLLQLHHCYGNNEQANGKPVNHQTFIIFFVLYFWYNTSPYYVFCLKYHQHIHAEESKILFVMNVDKAEADRTSLLFFTIKSAPFEAIKIIQSHIHLRSFYYMGIHHNVYVMYIVHQNISHI